MQRVLNGLRHTALSLSVSCAHDSHSTVFEHGLHVLVVHADLSVHGDDLRYALSRIAERIIGDVETVLHGLVGIELEKSLVVDDQHGVYIFSEFVDSVERLVDFAGPFPLERYGDNTDGEDVELLCHPRHYRSRSRSGSAAHTSRDEHHLRAILEHLLDFRQTFLRLFLSLLRVVAGSESFAELQLIRHRRILEVLLVGVAHGKSDIMDSLVVHVVYRVSAASTDSHHLDDALRLALWQVEREFFLVSLLGVVAQVEIKIQTIFVHDSVISFQLSVFRNQFSVFSFQFSVIY